MEEVQEILIAKYINNIIKNLERLESIGAISNNKKHQILKTIIKEIKNEA